MARNTKADGNSLRSVSTPAMQGKKGNVNSKGRSVTGGASMGGMNIRGAGGLGKSKPKNVEVVVKKYKKQVSSDRKAAAKERAGMRAKGHAFESFSTFCEKVGGSGTLVRQGIKAGGKKGGQAVKKGTTAATAVGKEKAAQAAKGKPGAGKGEQRGAAIGGTIGAVAGAAIPDGPAMVAGEIAGGIAGAKIGGKIGRQFDKKKTVREFVGAAVAGAHGAVTGKKGDKVRKAVGSGAGYAVGSKVGSKVGGAVGQAAGNAAVPLVGGAIGKAVGSTVGAVAGGVTGAKVGSKIGKKKDKVEEAIRVQVDYHSGQGEKIQSRTKKYMEKKGQKGAPGLDAMKARTADHKARRGVKEEASDHIKDRRLEKYGIGHDGSDRKSTPSRSSGEKPKGKTVLQKETEKKYGKGKSALDIVKAKITAKHGKGAIMKNEEVITELSSDTLQKASKAADIDRGKKAVAGDKEGAKKRVKQASRFFKAAGAKRKEEAKEEYTVTNADKKGNTPAYKAYKAGKKNAKTGKPLYKAADHMKESRPPGYWDYHEPDGLKRFSDFLSEGNPTTRMMGKSKSQTTGNISADRGTDAKKNKESRKGLEKDLKKKGIGYKKGTGEYKYDDGSKGREVSYQTSPGKGMSKRRFGKVMRRLGRKHGQESVITKDKDKPARLHDTESKKPGKSVNIGKSKPGKHPEGSGETSGTKVRGKKLSKTTNKPSYHYG